MKYFYARVSTEAQNIARQLDAARAAGIVEENIFIDKESGKDFNRTNWRKLTRKLKKGDVLFVKSLDRIGRNYKETIEQWQTLTKSKDVDIVVLDMPLLDTRREKNLLGTFIADVVLQILSFVAENERANIKQRQREGIAAAKARGVVFGRKPVELPENFAEVAKQYLVGEITGQDAADALNMATTTFTKYARRLGPKTGVCKTGYIRPPQPLPSNFERVCDLFFAGSISVNDAAKKIRKSPSCFRNLARKKYPGRTRAKKYVRKPKLPPNFKEIAFKYFSGEMRLEDAAFEAKMSQSAFTVNAQKRYPRKFRERKSIKGRPKTPLTPQTEALIVDVIAGNIKQKEAAEILGVSCSTVTRLTIQHLDKTDRQTDRQTDSDKR